MPHQTYRTHQALLDQLHEIVFETDATGRLVYLNAALEGQLARTVADSLGTPLPDFLLYGNRPAWDRLKAGQPAAAGVRSKSLADEAWCCRLDHIPGLDPAKGLHLANGNGATYLRLLSEFPKPLLFSNWLRL